MLDNDPEAPQDLRDRALSFAGEILAFDPAIGNPADGRRRAEELLQSAAALNRFKAIVAAQGAVERVMPGRLTHVVRAKSHGVIEEVDGWHLAGIARRAGAPMDKSAGIYLAVAKGDRVSPGAHLFTIHATAAAECGGRLVARGGERRIQAGGDVLECVMPIDLCCSFGGSQSCRV